LSLLHSVCLCRTTGIRDGSAHVAGTPNCQISSSINSVEFQHQQLQEPGWLTHPPPVTWLDLKNSGVRTPQGLAWQLFETLCAWQQGLYDAVQDKEYSYTAQAPSGEEVTMDLMPFQMMEEGNDGPPKLSSILMLYSLVADSTAVVAGYPRPITAGRCSVSILLTCMDTSAAVVRYESGGRKPGTHEPTG
jgi:hypothetical protein